MNKRQSSVGGVLQTSRALKVLGDCTSVLVDARSEQQIFADVCRIVVRSGGYRMAWVGVAETGPAKRIRPLAQFGYEDGYLDNVTITWDESSRGRGPAGTAIRTGHLQTIQNILVNPVMAPWRADAIKRGYQSVIALPFVADGNERWVLTVYAAEIDAFEPAETRLLKNLVNNVAFGISALHARVERERAIKELEFKNAILLAQQETSIDGILVLDEWARILSFNRRFSELWRLPEHLLAAGDNDAVVIQQIMDKVNDPEAFIASVRSLIRRQDATDSDEVSLKDGRTIERYSGPATGLNGMYHGRVWYFRDITERTRNKARIARLSRIQAVLSGVNSAIVRIGNRDQLFREVTRVAIEDGKFALAWIGTVNSDQSEITPVVCDGRDADGVFTPLRFGTDSSERVPADEIWSAVRQQQPISNNDLAAGFRHASDRKIIAVQSGYRSAIALPLVVKDTTVGIFVLCSTEPGFFDETELGLMNEIGGDISFALDHIAKQERFDFLAYYDTLTCLPNRSLFLERLGERLRLSNQSGQGGAVAVLDVVRFRYWNGTFSRGHGDILLKMVAERLTQTCGEYGSVARMNADLFAFMLDRIEDETEIAQSLSCNVLAAFAQPFCINDQDVRISVRLGITTFPRDGSNAEALCKNAEIALLRAKEAKETIVFYSTGINTRVSEFLHMENRLKRAIEQQQFALYYQPIIHSKSGEIASLEALIRWRDPERGLIPPGDFIPILEDTGLILQVGEWTICEALRDRERWRNRGLDPPRIAVNVSAVQLRQKLFVSTIEKLIAGAGNTEHGLDLEITESVIMTDVDDNMKKLDQVKGMNFKIAVDDFGTGYSSFQYLARLPVDSLKIDQSFIARILGSRNDRVIVSTIVALAHNLQLSVTGEGIELGQQASLLRGLKCDRMQGFLFHRPLPADQLEALLTARPGPASANRSRMN